MPWTVEHFDVSTYHDVVTDRDFASNGKRGKVSDTDVVSDTKARLVRVTGRERKTAFSMDDEIISDDQLAAAPNPLNKGAGMHIASVLGAGSFKEGLADKDAETKIIDFPEE
jgi:hypothetical protein